MMYKFDNGKAVLAIGDDGCAKSLVIKSTGEEMLVPGGDVPFCTARQERPFNNETKLVHPNQSTYYAANRLRVEGDMLIVGFEVAPYEAEIRVGTGDGYFSFTLLGWRTNTVDEHQYARLVMDVPPVVDFTLVQLAIKERENFGEWIDAVWDDGAAVAVISSSPYEIAFTEKRHDGRSLSVGLTRDIKTIGGTAVVVTGAGKDDFLDSMESAENDFDMPRGVASRRDDRLNASIYWTWNACPSNIDEHIAMAKKGGFRMMLFYYTCFVKSEGYALLGDYDWRDDYPSGTVDVAGMLDKVKAAGITPGFHTLQTHIGLRSRYVCPVADPRLNKTRLFTLSRAVGNDDTEIYVEESPVNTAMRKECRVLQFGGELISYEGYTTERPFRFFGCRRGAYETNVTPHPRGEIGGTLDISEFGATSCYIDQRTSLQDEIAEKIAAICDAGMEFCYFDGSEGVNPPCGVNVSLSQYRVIKKLRKMPIFTEGAAKSHFGWHFQAGANAFDTFPPEVFKRKIIEYPAKAAKLMRKNFTRVDFGWWNLRLPDENCIGTQPDMWEYGASKAAAWDCPVTVQVDLDTFRRHPRIDELMEVMRRWEDVRARHLLPDSDKEKLKDPDREFHLVPNRNGGYDIV